MELWIIFFSIVFTVLIARLITLLVLRWKVLPTNTLSNGKRFHHFVYGNFLIVLAGMLVIGLGVSPSNFIAPLIFGVGLGLVLDEYPHWTGNVKELQRNTEIIPGALRATFVFELIILTLIFFKIYGII